MKEKIHPDYHNVVFRDTATGDMFMTRSTATSKEKVKWEDGKEYPLINVEVTDKSHPFYTGKQRMVGQSGQVQKFRERYGDRE